LAERADGANVRHAELYATRDRAEQAHRETLARLDVVAGERNRWKLDAEAAVNTLRAIERHCWQLREALKPFAAAADLDDGTSDTSEIWEMAAAMSITAGDLRAAKRALNTE
jgi:hypothetical protein